MREHVARSSSTPHKIFRKHPEWPVVDVTGRAIEETAVIILEHLRDREPGRRQSLL
jgi:regulator of PEP synthase PpsR (kinase-PPPase family)